MHLLLDTQIVLWLISKDRRLSEPARQLIDQGESRHVSVATLWEIAIKVKLGKLNADLDKLIGNLNPSGFLELPVYSRHTAQVAQLPLLHGDPFDRMLVAQAISESMFLVTADSQLSQYSNLVIRV